MNLQGTFTISRTTHSHEDDSIRIELRDETSGIRFMVGKIKLANFAVGLTGLAARPIEMELRGLENVGMVAERRTEVVEFNDPGFSSPREEAHAAAAIALHPFEIDGWTGCRSDLFNHRNLVSGSNSLYRVGFTRYVPAKGENAE